MNEQFITKDDLRGKITGLEQYIPGDATTKDLAIKVSSGTGGAGPTMLVEKSPVEGKREHYLNRAHALIRFGGQTTSALAGVNLLLRHAPIERTIALGMKDVQHPAFAHVCTDFAATEIYTVPFAFLRNIMHVLKNNARKAFTYVTYVFLSGEHTGTKEKTTVAAQFPKLKEYIDDYGAAESGSCAFGCKYLSDRYEPEGLLAFHPITAVDPHIVDADEEGVGEIVVSTNELKNYRTGDLGRIVSEACACGDTKTLILLGRKDIDIVNCRGATFTRRNLEEALEPLKELVNDYRVEVSEVDDADALRGKVSARIASARTKPDAELLTLVERQLLHKMKVTPTRTLGDLVIEGIFLPLDLRIVKSIDHGIKTVRLKKIV